MSRSQVGRLERGESRALPLDTADRVAMAVGGWTELLLRWNGEGLDRLLDERHASLVEAVVRRLRALGWDVAVEVSFSRFGERGAIDVLAWHPEYRALAVFEVKSVTPDMQAMLGGLDRKARLGPAIARESGWAPLIVARVLVLADTRTNRRRVEEHAATVRAALPAGTRAVQHWLAHPRSPGIAGVWFATDVRRAAANGGQRDRMRVPRARASTDFGGKPRGGPPGGY